MSSHGRLKRTPLSGFGAHCNLIRSHLTKTLFPNRFAVEVLGGYEFWEDTLQTTTAGIRGILADPGVD